MKFAAFVLVLITTCGIMVANPQKAQRGENQIADDINYTQGLVAIDAGDYYEGLKLLGLSAKEGNHDAQYRIGMIYKNGEGVKQNPNEAVYWFRKAASNGHCLAQYAIGKCFAEGYGVLQDDRVAAEWIWRAAQQNLPEAMYDLAEIYLQGRGMPSDIAKAAEYFNKAAACNYKDAAVKAQSLKDSASTQAKTSDTVRKSSARN